MNKEKVLHASISKKQDAREENLPEKILNSRNNITYLACLVHIQDIETLRGQLKARFMKAYSRRLVALLLSYSKKNRVKKKGYAYGNVTTMRRRTVPRNEKRTISIPNSALYVHCTHSVNR